MSNRKFRDATYSIHKLVKASHIQSYSTRADTEAILVRSIKNLHELGFIVSHIAGIKKKHVAALVEHWAKNQLSAGTIKNYIAKLRWACRETGRPNIIDNNETYGIGKRTYQSANNKAIHDIDLNKIENPEVRMSLMAQQLFGLRREESLKLVVSQADKGSHLLLKSSWTKGGIERSIPIVSEEQRSFLNELRRIVGENQSLIPKGQSYKDQMNRYVFETRKAGFRNLHGLRHAYAQSRYTNLVNEFTNGSGWKCPYQGGPKSFSLDKDQQEIDQKVRAIISNELGHSRIQIVKIYCA